MWCVSLSHSRRQYCHTHKHACTHTHMRVHTNQYTGKRRDSYWVASQWERRAERREGRSERASAREREREVSSHVQDQKVKRQISLLSPKEASPSEGSVRRLRNRRNTLLLWWFKGDMTSRSSLKSQLVSDSVSQLWREFLLSDAWLCSGGLQPGGLTTEEGIKGRSRNKSLLIPPPTPILWPADPSRNFFCWEALSREHGWIYDYVMRILDGHWRHVSLTFSWRCLTGKIRCDRSVLVECKKKKKILIYR